ncbi:alpha/beta hydrolase family protein [Pseudoduganella sp. OTU4001]|uniref:alpha/beta hydrolase family protein n=1 Tax=Pseudoduganella sp. OTU4001 TaxID=3043854 RepID=UPI00313EE4E5
MKIISLTLAIALGLGAAPAALCVVNPPAAEAFFENPAFSGAVISPNGRFIAAKIGTKGKRNSLAVVELATQKIQVVAHFGDTDINHVQWVNDQRLLFDSNNNDTGFGDTGYGPGLYAVDRDGANFKQLASRWNKGFKNSTAQRDILPFHTVMRLQSGPKNSEWVYVEDHTDGNVGLLRVNTVTGRTQTVARPGEVSSWLLDEAGLPRLASTRDKAQVTMHLRDSEDGPWRVLTSYNAFTGGKGAMHPLAFGADNSLYIESSQGHDKTAIYRMDLATGKIDDKPLLNLDGYDFKGNLVIRGGKLVGVHYLRDGENSFWFDPALQALQAEIDQKLPQTVNMLDLPSDLNAPTVLVRAYSDTRPDSYYVYDRSTKTLNKVGDTRPGIAAEQMGIQEQVRIKARDGLEIPVMLTLPQVKEPKKLPLVVLVHGGPYVRGSTWGWRPDVQFLASRGYAVLQPEFRGSTGYGSRHFRAGWKQWGLKMQDDIADATKWAIAQGYADPQRICIAGASYGGYATLMGLVNDPQLYRCGVDWVGVTDITLLFTGHWLYRDDSNPIARQYGMPELIGDPVKDAERFKATSPIEQAHRITQPLLMAYGGADLRVPLVHGLKMRDAVSRSNQQVEWVEYEFEAHGWNVPANKIDFWTRVEKFLAKHIGTDGQQHP